MRRNKRELLSVLKAELDFVEKGGYRSATDTPWRPTFVFQDSPTCLNFNMQERPRPCSECLLMEFVPPERRDDKIPCRQIPLSELGDTIDSYYRTGTQEDLEVALTNWLKASIKRLESGRQHVQSQTNSEAVGKVLSTAE